MLMEILNKKKALIEILTKNILKVFYYLETIKEVIFWFYNVIFYEI